VAWSSAWTGSGNGSSRPAANAPAAAIPHDICTRLSNPRRWRQGPSQPYALSEAMISAGLIAVRVPSP